MFSINFEEKLITENLILIRFELQSVMWDIFTTPLAIQT